MARGLPSTPLYKSENEERLYLKTNIDGWFFDGFLNISQTHSLKVTTHPVQSGADITDHAYEEPITIEAKIIVSDAYTADNTKRDAQLFLANGETKSVGAFNVLRRMQSERRLLKVVTKYGSYNNMLLVNLKIDTDYKNIYNMLADVTLQEVIIANEKTVQVSARNQTTGTSSPDPSTKATTPTQEYENKAAAGKALEDASNDSNSGITKTTYKVPGDPIAHTLYEGNENDLLLVMNAVPSYADKKAFKSKSAKQALGVYTTVDEDSTISYAKSSKNSYDGSANYIVKLNGVNSSSSR